MPGGDLRRLKVQNLRGCVTELTLDFARHARVTVIYGENGSGKTTICDALEFVGKGKIGSLEDRGLGGGLMRFWPSIGKAPGDVRVALETRTASYVARIDRGQVTVHPADDRPRVAILRRPSILRLIDAPPGQKYEEIRHFVDVGPIEDAEAAFRVLIDDLEAKRNNDVATILAYEEQLSQFWTSAGAPGPSALAWAEAQMREPPADTGAIVASLGGLTQAYAILSPYPDRFERSNSARSAAEIESARAREAYAEALRRSPNEADTLSILEAAEEYLSDTKHDNANCPLCQSTERAHGLLDNVRGRIESMREVRVAAQAVAEADQRLRDANAALFSIAEQYSADREQFAAATEGHSRRDQRAAMPAPPPMTIESVGQWLQATGEISETWSTTRERLLEETQFISTLRATLDTYRTSVDEQRTLDALLPRLERARAIVREERQRYTDEVLSSIARRVGELYEQVHPGEGGSTLSMELTPTRRASLDLESTFGGTSVPPTAYYSQSHLDTLGICVFLALMERDAADQTILVLDDVLASLDEPHVERLVRMIGSLAVNFRHCIVTTHYRPWREKLKWGLLRDGTTELLELKRWSRSGGIQLTKTTPEIDRLRADLAVVPPDLQAIVAKAGVILEAVLDHITLIYECALPRKRGTAAYTLGELLNGISSRLRLALRIEVRTEDPAGAVSYVSTNLAPLLGALQEIAQVRNAMGAHFNELSFELLDDDALRFGEKVLELAELVVDAEKGWPMKPDSGSYWETAGDARRMHPFARPT